MLLSSWDTFNYPNMSWQGSTAGQEQPREFVERVDDSFLRQVISVWRRVDSLLSVIPTNSKDLEGHGKVREGLGCTDQEMMEFRIQRKGNKAKSRITALNFSRADFALFRGLLVKVPQGTTVGRRRVQESLLFFRNRVHHIQAQEWLSPRTKISSKSGRRPTWMHMGLLNKLKYQKEIYRMWREGEVAQDKYSDSTF